MNAIADSVAQAATDHQPFQDQALISRPLRFVTCGSVDDGKSTLIGRMLWDCKAIFDDQARSLENSGARAQNDAALPDFAHLLDGLQAEREQGITIDVAYRFFSTERRNFIIADTPGHEQFTRNMATGASSADAAVLLVDARKGILTQTRRHAKIATLLGIRHLILAVNKMDLVEFDQATFDAVLREFEDFAQSLPRCEITAIPLSALRGVNVLHAGHTEMPWYTGPTLVKALEDMPDIVANDHGGLRLPIQSVARPNESFRGYRGTIANGSLHVGDEIVVQPSGQTTKVTSIVTMDGELQSAAIGRAVTVTLQDEIDISRGDVLAAADRPAHTAKDVTARIVWLSDKPLGVRKRFLLKCGTRVAHATVEARSRLDLSNLQWEPCGGFTANDIGTATVHTDIPLVWDAYEQSRAMGAFILIDRETNATVAAGMIDSEAKAREPEQTIELDGPAILIVDNGQGVEDAVENARRYSKDKTRVVAVGVNDLDRTLREILAEN